MEFRYLVTIWTNYKKVEWKTNDISPSNIEEVVSIEDIDGDFVTKGEIKDLQTGKILELSDDGDWNFIEREA